MFFESLPPTLLIQSPDKMQVITVAISRTNPTCLPSTLYLFVVISAPNAQAMQSKSADASELSTIVSEETSNTFCPSTSRTTAAKAAPINPTRYIRALFIRAPYHNRFVASRQRTGLAMLFNPLLTFYPSESGEPGRVSWPALACVKKLYYGDNLLRRPIATMTGIM